VTCHQRRKLVWRAGGHRAAHGGNLFRVVDVVEAGDEHEVGFGGVLDLVLAVGEGGVDVCAAYTAGSS